MFGPSQLCAPLLWPRLTSARASSAPDGATSGLAHEQISQGKTRDRRSIHPPHIRPASPDDRGLRVFVPSRPPAKRLVCGSCSSGRSFACGFLPTSPHGDAVAVRLGVPVIKVPRGLAPPSHFPNRFRYRLTAPVRRCAPCLAHTTKKPAMTRAPLRPVEWRDYATSRLRPPAAARGAPAPCAGDESMRKRWNGMLQSYLRRKFRNLR